jgi:diaminopropionate ammonia-lyase
MAGLDSESRDLVFGSEGDTDPAICREVVGRPADAVRAGRNDAPPSALPFDP